MAIIHKFSESHYRSVAGIKVRLFCFPYAGASASVFRSWSQLLPHEVEVNAVQLPGREERIREKPQTHLPTLIETLVPVFYSYLDMPFVFFGHSLGALIGFEIARHLATYQGINPHYLFVSGCRAPQLPDHRSPFHMLPEMAFREEVLHLGGFADELICNKEAMEFFLPLLRADFTLFETYTYTDRERLSCPILAFGGREDPETSYEELQAWKNQTSSTFVLRMFPGNHFFLHDVQAALLQAIAEKIMGVL